MQPCFGVKGISPLHILPSFNIVDGAVIDYMHCLLESIGKSSFICGSLHQLTGTTLVEVQNLLVIASPL